MGIYLSWFHLIWFHFMSHLFQFLHVLPSFLPFVHSVIHSLILHSSFHFSSFHSINQSISHSFFILPSIDPSFPSIHCQWVLFEDSQYVQFIVHVVTLHLNSLSCNLSQFLCTNPKRVTRPSPATTIHCSSRSSNFLLLACKGNVLVDAMSSKWSMSMMWWWRWDIDREHMVLLTSSPPLESWSLGVLMCCSFSGSADFW